MDAFEGLADPVRRALLRRLVDGPARAGDLAADHEISRPAISRHLRVLLDAGLIDVEARGRERVFRLRPEGAAPVHQLIDELAPKENAPAVHRLGEGRLLALDTEVRRGQRAARPDAERGSGTGRDEEESA